MKFKDFADYMQRGFVPADPKQGVTDAVLFLGMDGSDVSSDGVWNLFERHGRKLSDYMGPNAVGPIFAWIKSSRLAVEVGRRNSARASTKHSDMGIYRLTEKGIACAKLRFESPVVSNESPT